VADRLTPERRRWLMARIGGKNTVPEVTLRRALHAAGIRGWRLHARDLPGRPDLVFRRAKVAVFVDGAFWHGHPSKFSPGRLSPPWEAKIVANRERDRAADAALVASGWTVIRVWDIDLRRDVTGQVERIAAELQRRCR
jgi:DNA mismatch endonuclease (patch repair protein)